MVEKNPHSEEAAATQKLTAAKPADVGASVAAGGAGDGADSSKTRVLGSAKSTDAGKGSAGSSTGASSSGPVDPVAARRAAHGLSPETTSSMDAAEVRRKDKEANAEDRKRKVQRQHKAKVVRNTIIAIVLVLIVGIVVGFWLLRWGLHDDTESIQGKWRVQGTDTVINISDEEIVLTDEVAYDYVLDPEAKTLTFKFGALTGNGRYRFSIDHNMLAIDDGEFDAAGTLMTDIPWTLDALAQKLVGNPEKSPALESSDMVLERVG